MRWLGIYVYFHTRNVYIFTTHTYTHENKQMLSALYVKQKTKNLGNLKVFLVFLHAAGGG